jgi:hypothetical protein
MRLRLSSTTQLLLLCHFLLYVPRLSSYHSRVVSVDRSLPSSAVHRGTHLKMGSSTEGSTDDPDLQSLRGMKGFYVRPSRAIEKGGGFFVPGLEGGRIRVVSAVLLVFLNVVNNVGIQSLSTAETVSQSVGIAATVILLLQGISEVFATEMQQMASTSIRRQSNDFLAVIQSSNRTEDGNAVANIDAIARSIIKTCGGINYILVLRQAEVVYEIGPVANRPTMLGGSSSSRLIDRLDLGSESLIITSIDRFKQSEAQLGSVMGASFPSTTAFVGCLHTGGTYGLSWIIAAAADGDTTSSPLTSNKQWIEALISSTSSLDLT